MRGPRPAEGRVNRSYGGDGALSYRRSGLPDVTYKNYNFHTNPNPNTDLNRNPNRNLNPKP